jgi:hypothetical protein
VREVRLQLLRVLAALAIVTIAAFVLTRMIHAGPSYDNAVTAKYAEVMKTRGFDAAKEYAHNTLTSLLGDRIPEFELTRIDGSSVSIASFRGSSLALLWAGTGCPAVTKQLAEMSARDWKWPDYDKFVVLLWKGKMIRYEQLPKAPGSVAYVQWPFPGSLGCVSMTPTVLFVDRDGHFAGFKLGFDDPVFVTHGAPEHQEGLPCNSARSFAQLPSRCSSSSTVLPRDPGPATIEGSAIRSAARPARKTACLTLSGVIVKTF